MKTRHILLVALLSAASLLAPAAQAKTIFERFAPPLLLPIPLPVPVLTVSSYEQRDEGYRDDDRREWRRERYDDRRDWREDRRDWRDDHDRHERHEGRRDRDYRDYRD